MRLTSLKIIVNCMVFGALGAHAAQLPEVRDIVRSVDYEPYWSPDGTSIVFVSNRNGPMNLYRLEVSSGAVVRLTSHAGPDDTPAWSPDGSSVAFVSEVDGNPEVYVIHADGSNLRRVTFDPGLDLHPTWSADSKTILFNTSRYSAKPADADRIDICEMAVTGGSLRCFTHGGINTYASWSPDEATLLFRRSSGEQKSQLVLLRVASGQLVELTPGDAFDGWPSWSPDGTRVIFASDRTGEFQLFMLNADGTGGVQRILEKPGRYTNPRWAPTGDEILFTGRTPGDGDLELYSMKAPAPPSAAGAPKQSLQPTRPMHIGSLRSVTAEGRAAELRIH